MYVTVITPCASCHRIISCNPNHVPSVKDSNGIKVPLCLGCANELNKVYVKAGKEPVPIHPDAYKAEDESKVKW